MRDEIRPDGIPYLSASVNPVRIIAQDETRNVRWVEKETLDDKITDRQEGA